MGYITSWIEKVHKEHGISLPEDERKQIINSIYEAIVAALARRFPGGRAFGADLGTDLAQEAILWLLTAMNGENRLPKRVIDRPTLVFMLCDKAFERSYGRWKRQRGLKGGSAQLDPDDELSQMGSFSVVPDRMRKGGPTFDIPGTELTVMNALDAAVADLELLSNSNGHATEAFRLKTTNNNSATEIAIRLNRSNAQIYTYLKQAKFCLMRRQGWSQKILAKEFGNILTEWEERLVASGRKVNSEDQL